ncbi:MULTISPECIES: PKD-like domain-containing protein [Flavobacterium]|uniref:PKD-like domain-containing protein n=1 Tax=Flavobacterium TaxID=237 RepID=UPI001FCC0AF7|nr:MULTISPECIES: PKD-like domain-containing protein [Flavobacterium]UOK43889.1 T9SS type A sorting domain-containing protein [Flavobacterium enshiense]
MKKIFTFLLLVSFGSLMAANTTEEVTCPTASATVSSSTICSGETTGIALTSNVVGTTYTWQVLPNNLLGASSGSGNAINQTLAVINSNYSGTVDYIITPFADNCTGTPIQVTITVNPGPEIFASPIPQSICNGSSTYLSLSSFNPDTTYSWNVVMTDVTGGSSGTNTTGSINQILTLTGQGPGQAVYTVTPFLGGCIGTPVTIICNVYPRPTVTVNSPTVCSGSSATVTATPGASGTYTYSWTVPPGAANPGNVASFTTTTAGTYSVIASNNGCESASASGVVTVKPAAGSFNLQCGGYNDPGHPNALYIDWSNVVGITNFNYSYSINGDPIVTGSQSAPSSMYITTNGQPVTFTLSGTGTVCVAPETITVNPIPTVTVNSSTICSGSTATVTATLGTSGSHSYTWTVPAGVPNPGNVPSFTTTTAGTYFVIVSNNDGCGSASASGIVTILPSPDITATATNQSINSGDLTNISLSSNSPGATYQWTVTQNNVTGATSGSGNTINQQLSLINTALQGSATYTITSMSGGCSRNVTAITITVNSNLDTNDFNSPNFIVSPNPVTDILNIKNNQTINKVTAFNQLGQMVLQKEYNNNEVQLDFSALKTGIYFISVDSGKKQSTFKIVKN